MPSSYTKNRTSKKPHLLRAGGLAGEITDLRSDLQAEVSGSLWATQTSWAINSTLGKDTNLGTPSQPLKTMEEFSNRMTSLTVKVPATLQLVGDVLDSPIALFGLRCAIGASLTVSGTRTDIGTALLSVVAGVGPTAAVFPWQLTTTGIDWTVVPLTAQVRLPTGEVAMIVEAVDANNVIVGPFGALVSGSTNAAPTVGLTVTVATLSRALPPTLNGLGAASFNSVQLQFQHLNFDSPSTLGVVGVNEYMFTGGLATQLSGCNLNFTNGGGQFFVGCPFFMRCCRWTTTQSVAWRCGMDSPSANGLVVAGSGATIYNHQAGWTSYTNLTLIGARLFVTGAQVALGVTHIRKTAGPCVVQSNGYITSGGILNSGAALAAAGNTGIGLDVSDGRFIYFSSSKPTLTGGSDTRVGGVAKTYAAIPFVNWDATVPGAFTGNGAAIVQV